MIEEMRHRLAEKLAPSTMEIVDDSAAHAGHAGARSGGGHFNLRIVSTRFENLSRIARHRLVYDALADLMQGSIHALAIVALTPEETGRPPSMAPR